MKKLSFWARNHKIAARFIIVVSQILLAATGIFTGILLKSLGFSFSSITLIVLIIAFAICFIFYPVKNKRSKSLSFYIKQKSFHLALATVSFLLVVFAGNRPNTLLLANSDVSATVPVKPPADSASHKYKSIKDFSASMKDGNGKTLKWKERKKLLKAQVKAIRKSSDLSKGEKTTLVILSVLVAIGLLFLVAAISCNLSCSGYDGAAALVGLGGGVLVILLLIVAIRAIYKKERKKRLKKAEEQKKTGEG